MWLYLWSYCSISFPFGIFIGCMFLSHAKTMAGLRLIKFVCGFCRRGIPVDHILRILGYVGAWIYTIWHQAHKKTRIILVQATWKVIAIIKFMWDYREKHIIQKRTTELRDYRRDPCREGARRDLSANRLQVLRIASVMGDVLHLGFDALYPSRGMYLYRGSCNTTQYSPSPNRILIWPYSWRIFPIWIDWFP